MDKRLERLLELANRAGSGLLDLSADAERRASLLVINVRQGGTAKFDVGGAEAKLDGALQQNAQRPAKEFSSPVGATTDQNERAPLAALNIVALLEVVSLALGRKKSIPGAVLDTILAVDEFLNVLDFLRVERLEDFQKILQASQDSGVPPILEPLLDAAGKIDAAIGAGEGFADALPPNFAALLKQLGEIAGLADLLQEAVNKPVQTLPGIVAFNRLKPESQALLRTVPGVIIDDRGMVLLRTLPDDARKELARIESGGLLEKEQPFPISSNLAPEEQFASDVVAPTEAPQELSTGDLLGLDILESDVLAPETPLTVGPQSPAAPASAELSIGQSSPAPSDDLFFPAPIDDATAAAPLSSGDLSALSQQKQDREYRQTLSAFPQ